MKLRRIFSLVLLLGLCSAAELRAVDVVFWEAEDTSNTNMSPNGPYKPLNAEEGAKLSGGQWLNGKVGAEALFAEYTVKVPAAGTYHFFARKFWQHGAFRWRFDEGEWNDVRKTDIMDTVVLREYVPLTWVFLNDTTLAAGEHKLRIEMVEDPGYEFSKTYGFDCFLLTQGELSDYLKTNPSVGSEPK